VQRQLKFTQTAAEQLTKLAKDSTKAAILKQVRKALGFLERNPGHSGLHTHEFTSLAGAKGERIFEAYAQNQTPGAYRIFWHYGPDSEVEGVRTAVLTIVAITPHP